MKRRKFVVNTALGVSALSWSAKSYGRILGANDRINFAVVGVRSRGKAHIHAIEGDQRGHVATLCDVDTKSFAEGQKSMKDASTVKLEKDFRKVLEDKNIDAISVATPDHWHAIMGIWGMRNGKDVYLEKPCSYNPNEGELLIQTQKDTGRVLQIGNQQRSSPTSQEAIQMIKEGVIGRPYKGHTWYANKRGSIGYGKTVPVPENLDWELWQGPAPRREYKDNYVHYNWHWFTHWGTGEINNNALHEVDIARWALDVGIPVEVSSAGGRYHFVDDWEFFDTQSANFEFEDGKLITWDGRSCNPMPTHGKGRGTFIYGTDGTAFMDRNGYEIFDLNGTSVKEMIAKSKSATTDTMGLGELDFYHMSNFMDGITKGSKLNSPIEEAHKSTLLCHLGNMAQFQNKTLKVDSRTGKVLNSEEAMQNWSRKYEKGWGPDRY